MALMANPLTPHQPPRADPPADPSTYYSGCVRAFTPPEPLGTRDFPPTDTGARKQRSSRAKSEPRNGGSHENPTSDPRRALFSFSNFLERSLSVRASQPQDREQRGDAHQHAVQHGPTAVSVRVRALVQARHAESDPRAQGAHGRKTFRVSARGVRSRVPQLWGFEIAREDALGRARARLRDVRQGSVVPKRAQSARARAAHAGPPVQMRRALVRHDLHDAPRPRPAHR